VSDHLSLLEYGLVDGLEKRIGPGVAIVLTDNQSTMVSARRSAGKLDVRLSRLFCLADEALMEDLAAFVTGRVKSVSQRLRRFIDTPPAMVKPGPKRRITLKTKGAWHNLKDIAQRVNRRHFDSGLTVRITWGRAPSRRRRRSIQYGSYDESLDLIRIHPVLDAAFVPEAFVECVVYHEMLHKKLGVGGKNGGRRSLHPPRFRELERRHEHYDAAAAWERENFSKLLRAAGPAPA